MNKKTVLYCRVSTDIQRERESIQTQIERLTAYAKREGIHGEVYKDDGYTASNINRPAFKRLISEIDGGKVGKVVVTSLSRVTRNMRDFFPIFDLLSEKNVAFKCLDQHIDFSTASSRAMTRMGIEFAMMEREQTAERVTNTMRFRAENGKWNGGVVPFGYMCLIQQKNILMRDGLDEKEALKKAVSVCPEEKRLYLNDLESGLIRKMFKWYIDIKSIRGLVDKLNKAGLKSRYGKWTTSSIARVLTNPIYIGEFTYNKRATLPTTGKFVKQEQKNWIRSKGAPVIVDNVTFNQVQKLLRENKRVPKYKGAEYLLRGLLTCAKCGGGKMRGTIQTNREGKHYRYYRCMSGHYYGNSYKCRNLINSDFIEKIVVDTLNALLKDRVLMNEKELAKRYKLRLFGEDSVDSRIATFQRENEKINRQIERLLSFATNDDFASQSARSKINELGEKLRENQVLIEESESKNEHSAEKLGKFIEIAESFPKIWSHATNLQKRDILGLVFSKISFRDKGTPLTLEGRSVFGQLSHTGMDSWHRQLKIGQEKSSLFLRVRSRSIRLQWALLMLQWRRAGIPEIHPEIKHPGAPR